MMVMKSMAKILLKTVLIIVLLVFTIILVRAFDARSMLPLKVWHRTTLETEFRAGRMSPPATLAEYMKLEKRLFEELDEKVYRQVAPSEDLQFSRYAANGLGNPRNLPVNWNRTFEFTPARIKGAALLLHGLTDSPYSLRKVGEILHQHGFYVLGLRLPGHGTIPAALTSANYEDWMAVTRMGVKHVKEKIGDRGPFFLVGYSNGGALAVKYALEAAENSRMAMPDRLILFSPEIGVTPLATFANWHNVLSFMPYFEQFRWESIEPEYDPFKYNSFPKFAGEQSYLLTRAIQKQIGHSIRAGNISKLPPILTFLSLVDSTVLTDATVDKLYGQQVNAQSELVLFDINRLAPLRAFLATEHDSLLRRLEENPGLTYRLTVVSNRDEESREVVEKTRPPGPGNFAVTPLGLHWPQGVYSLSHVAIPFAPDDPIYGIRDPGSPRETLALGLMAPRGEKKVLRISLDRFMRLRSNPFFDYVEKRLTETVSTAFRKPALSMKSAPSTESSDNLS